MGKPLASDSFVTKRRILKLIQTSNLEYKELTAIIPEPAA